MTVDPRMQGVVDLLMRCGALMFQLRYSDDDQPVVWMAVAMFTGDRWDVAAGMTPLAAVLRLADQVIDGGTCTHCSRPTGCDHDAAGGDSPFNQLICWYRWNPELRTYRRTCEGLT